MIKDFGLEHDAHAGKWHRQISLLAVEAVRAFEENIISKFLLVHLAKIF